MHTQIHQHRSKNEPIGDTGDAARARSPHCTDLNQTTGEFGSHDFTLPPARQRTAVSRQVKRNPLSRLLAHDPRLTLTCIFAPANDRDDMVSATSRGGNDSLFPVQQRHSIDTTSNWTALENIIGPCRKRRKLTPIGKLFRELLRCEAPRHAPRCFSAPSRPADYAG